MSDTLTFRPRFRFHSEQTAEEFASNIVNHEGKSDTTVRVRKMKNGLELYFPEKERHLWTPHMEIKLEQDEEHAQKHLLARCLIAPSPTIWTFLMFAYGLAGFLGFVGLTLGMSQWTLKKPMWGFWMLLASLVMIFLVYLASYEGKRLSRSEMFELKKFVDDALGCDCIELAEKSMA